MPIFLDSTASFKQHELMKQTLPHRLNRIAKKYNGLCELICNRIIMKDLLGKGNSDFLKEKLSATKLNKSKVVNSHMLQVYSLVRKVMAFLFRIYPDNLFSYKDQRRLVTKSTLDFDLFMRKLDSLENGTTLKLQLFTRKFLIFYGHSTLVKKVNDHEFIFFDPNDGEHRHLGKFGLAYMINDRMSLYGANDLFFLKSSSYLDLLRKKNIL